MSVTCFLCLTETDNAATIDSEKHEIFHQIQECLQFKISFNGVKTTSICKNCKSQLTRSYGFFTKIHNAQSSGVKLGLKLSACKKNAKPLTVSNEKLNNNNCIERFEEEELDIKDETFEEEKSDESSEEDACEDSSEEDEEKKEPNSLAVINNWKSYPWYCYQCTYSTLNFSTLIGHIKLKHEISDIKKIQYQCVDCTKKLTSYTVFLNHVRLDHQPCLNLCCDICSESFSEYSNLAEHRREHNNESELQQPMVFHCNHCSKVFPSRKTINSHVLTHEKGLKCQVCDKSFHRLKYLKRHMEMHKDGKYKCSYCSKTFFRQFNKISHERTHTGERPYKCDQCEKVFRFQSTLKSHQQTHTEERRYKCDHCSYQSNHMFSLKEHIRKHTKENPFSCEECHKDFRYRKSWRLHMEKHPGKKAVKTRARAKKSRTTISKANIKTKKTIEK